MRQRDEISLFHAIENVLGATVGGRVDEYSVVADDLTTTLVNLGWRPPARTVSTVEEIEALPVDSVIRNGPSGLSAQRIAVGWLTPGVSGAATSEFVASEYGPLAVLYDPAGETTGSGASGSRPQHASEARDVQEGATS